MANFSYLGSATSFSASGTAASVSYASKANSSLVVGVLLSAGTVSSLADNLGLDADGNAINTWSKLDSVSVAGGGEMEFWEARNAAAIASVSLVLSTTVKCTVIIAEYSGIGSFTTAYHVSNVAASTLTLDETGSDSSECFIGFWGCTAALVSAITTGTSRLNAHGTGADLADMGLCLADNTISKLVGTFASSQPVQAIGISFNVGFALNHIPGFADISDATLAAEQNALGRKIASISENAAFGMVRLESFTAQYVNGDTVPLPVSPIDGYSYSRDELTYIWGVQSSMNPGTNWQSAKDSLWYAAWLVNQDTGEVATDSTYRRSGSHSDPSVTTDGRLIVTTVAQRSKTALTLAAIPSYKSTDPSIYVQDAALTQQMLQDLSHNAKYGVVNAEVIYMGEFYNGQTVPQPVSPADGYEYLYSECTFQHSWRWTTLGTSFTQPDVSFGQLGPIKASVSSVGVVSCSAAYINDAGTLSTKTTHGRIAVFALCQRDKNHVVIDGLQMPWSNAGGINASFPIASGAHIGTAPYILTVKAGGSISISYVSGGIDCDGASALAPTTDLVGHPNIVSTGTGPGGPAFFPAHYVAGSSLRLGGLVGAFTDSAGVIISVFDLTAGSGTFVVPVGATQVQLGINDDNYGDNTGSYTISLVRVSATVADDFEELDPSVMSPGDFLKASTMVIIDANTKEAAVTPEFFGPTTQHIGDTIALPVSPVDGYAYTNAECTFLWEWADTTMETGSNLRMPAFSGQVNQTSQKVGGMVWRLPPGGPTVTGDTTKPTFRVTVIASRQQVGLGAEATTTSSPSDLASQVVDQNDILINGA